MWDLDTIIRLNAERATAPKTAPTQQQLRIYEIAPGKFALGNLGEKAHYVVRRVANKADALGRGLPTYKGVQARRPRIPQGARLVRREDAGRLLLKALGLRN